MSGRPNQSRAVLARDAALARVNRTRRWVIAGAAALTAGLAALVSAVAPGKTLASKSPGRAEAATVTRPTASSSSSSAIPPMPPPATAGDLGLQAPNQAPSPAPDQSQPQSIPSQPPPSSSSSGGGGGVVSGGS